MQMRYVADFVVRRTDKTRVQEYIAYALWAKNWNNYY